MKEASEIYLFTPEAYENRAKIEHGEHLVNKVIIGEGPDYYVLLWVDRRYGLSIHENDFHNPKAKGFQNHMKVSEYLDNHDEDRKRYLDKKDSFGYFNVLKILDDL